MNFNPMRLTSIEYSEYVGQPNEWRLEKTALRDINLIVGKNASGKTRTLNVIAGIGRVLSNRQKPSFTSGTWKCWFDDFVDTYSYEVDVKDQNVISEQFIKNETETLLTRGADGAGKIFSTKENKLIDFQTPTTDLAAVNRRDSIQHQFFDKLFDWGTSVFSYLFGSSMGKDRLAIILPFPIEVDPYNSDFVIAIFRDGQRKFRDEFVDAIKSDMAELGYSIEAIETVSPKMFQMAVPNGPIGISVKEADLLSPTDQNEMSSGMFRSLSIIIQFNYIKMSSKAGCVIVDDIGEGLDFDRSCQLIDLLTKKSGNVQLILSTNDRFVMNRVPLERWIILRRHGHIVSSFNHDNSKDKFEEFRFTGLNNFDFFAMNFIDENSENTAEGMTDEKAGNIRRGQDGAGVCGKATN
jgi:hypothetical protein